MGPFETEAEARQAAAAAAGDARNGGIAAGNLAMLQNACAAAGVTLGAYDELIVEWLANFEPSACAVVAGLIIRAVATTDREPR
jgi:hypothetical protein